MVNPLKVGGGAFFMLLGVVLFNQFQNNLTGSILGIISIAIGITLIAWDVK